MPDPLTIRQRIFSRFGARALAPALFYAHEPALRFELSRDGGFVTLFTEAYDRARRILEHVFASSTDLTVILGLYGPPPLTRHLTLFRAIQRIGVSVTRPTEVWSDEGSAESEDDSHTWIAFGSDKANLHAWLWGALAQDLGIKPSLPCRLFLADLEAGVLAHPYDDRGMDIISTDLRQLRELYIRFDAFLLDQDRARMDGFFASAPA